MLLNKVYKTEFKKHSSPKSISCSLWTVQLFATWKNPSIPVSCVTSLQHVGSSQTAAETSHGITANLAFLSTNNQYKSIHLLGMQTIHVLDAPPLPGMAYGKVIRLPQRRSPAPFQPCQRRTQNTPKRKTPKQKKYISGQKPLRSNYVKRLPLFHSSCQLTIHI